MYDEHNEISNAATGAIYEEPTHSPTGGLSSAKLTQSPVRKLPSLPTQHGNPDNNYTTVNTTDDVTGSIIVDEPISYYRISSYFSPPPALEISYSGLESTTREPPQSLGVYDGLEKPDYVNVNIASTTEPISGIISDEQQCNYRIAESETIV